RRENRRSQRTCVSVLPGPKHTRTSSHLPGCLNAGVVSGSHMRERGSSPRDGNATFFNETLLATCRNAPWSDPCCWRPACHGKSIHHFDAPCRASVVRE